MAKFYRDPAGNYGLRRSPEEEVQAPIPGGSTAVEFDEETNAGLLRSLDGQEPGWRWQDHAISGGQIVRGGTPVAVNPDGQDKQDRDGFRAALQTALVRLQQIETAASGGLNNAQRDAAIGDLALILRRTLRRLALLTR